MSDTPGPIRAGERVTIVGGGLLGLTLASCLHEGGARVTVLEAAPELGGLAGAAPISTTQGPVTWDRFYHVILESDSALRALLRDLDLDRELHWTTTRTGYFADGRLSPVSGVADFVRLPGLSPVAKIRLAATLARGATARDWRALEATTAREWLTRWSGAKTFERFWVPLLEAKLGDAWPDANAAFIWATIQRLAGARRTGVGGERFGMVPGGYHRILTSLAAALDASGVTVRTGIAVQSVVADPGGGVVVTTAAGPEPADHAVVTTSPDLAAQLCPTLPDASRARLEGVHMQGVVCVALVLSRPLSPYYLTYLMDRLPFTAVVETTNVVPSDWLGGRSLVFLPRYAPASDGWFTADDATVVAESLAGLRRVHPVADADVLGARVTRAAQVFPVPTLGYSTRVPGFDTGVPGVRLVCSAQIVNGTLNVNETVGHAEHAAASLLGRAPVAPVGSAEG